MNVIWDKEVNDGQVVRAGVSVTEMYCHDLEVISSNCPKSYLIQTYHDRYVMK